MSESVYKVVDSRGRVHLPKEFRGKMDLDCGCLLYTSPSPRD